MENMIYLLDKATGIRRFLAGEVIFEQGDCVCEVFVIRTGTVEIYCGDTPCDVLGSGDVFGETRLFDEQPRFTRAVAKTDCVIVPVDSDRFNALAQVRPELAVNMLHVTAERLRRRADGFQMEAI